MGFGIRRKKTQHESRGRTFEAVNKAGRGVSLKAPLQSSSLGRGALGKGWGWGDLGLWEAAALAGPYWLLGDF